MRTEYIGILFEADIQRLSEIEFFINNNLEKELSISMLSDQFGVSQSTLRRQFKQHYQQSVYHFIFECRMKKAMLLVLDHQNTISQIALQLSYKHLSSFTRAFFKYYHQTPYQYLKNSERTHGWTE
jgi:AraC-like DNA-binding protein